MGSSSKPLATRKILWTWASSPVGVDAPVVASVGLEVPFARGLLGCIENRWAFITSLPKRPDKGRHSGEIVRLVLTGEIGEVGCALKYYPSERIQEVRVGEWHTPLFPAWEAASLDLPDPEDARQISASRLAHWLQGQDDVSPEMALAALPLLWRGRHQRHAPFRHPKKLGPSGWE